MLTHFQHTRPISRLIARLSTFSKMCHVSSFTISLLSHRVHLSRLSESLISLVSSLCLCLSLSHHSPLLSSISCTTLVSRLFSLLLSLKARAQACTRSPSVSFCRRGSAHLQPASLRLAGGEQQQCKQVRAAARPAAQHCPGRQLQADHLAGTSTRRSLRSRPPSFVLLPPRA